MLALPVLHHAEGLQSADNIVRVDGHFLADICVKEGIIELVSRTVNNGLFPRFSWN